MNLVVNCFQEHEIPLVMGWKNAFPSITVFSIFPEVATHIVTEAKKDSVEWTKRMLKYLFLRGLDHIVKIDPDTELSVAEMPLPELDCEVAGDFRETNLGLVFLGGYQYFTRYAARTLLLDNEYKNPITYQDVALGQAIRRNQMRAVNMPSVNSWWLSGDEKTPVLHRGREKMKRLPFGYLELK